MQNLLAAANYSEAVGLAINEVQGVLTANAGSLLVVTAAFVGFKVVKRLIKGIS